MYNFFKILIIVLITLYPFCIYFGLSYLSPAQLGLSLLAIFSVRIIFIKRNQPAKTWPIMLTIIVGASLAGLAWLYDTPEYLLWYPVGLNACLFIIFITSIFFPPTVIERMARLTEKDLSEKAITYTRNVTVVWSVFFVINASIAAWTVLYGGMKIWVLYNGLIAYLAIGVLFTLEYLVRRVVRSKEDVV